jgi:hypothetical protein
VPFADPEDRRTYDRERKRQLRSAIRSDPMILPAEARVRVVADVENLLGEAVRLVLSDAKAPGVQKARALGYLCSVGLRLIEAHHLQDRLEALEAALADRSVLRAAGP